MSTLKVDTIQSSTLASPVTINDSLTVAGNTAVTGTLSATGITSVTDATDATSTTAASLKTAGGLAVAKSIWVGGDNGINYKNSSMTTGITSHYCTTGGLSAFGSLSFNDVWTAVGMQGLHGGGGGTALRVKVPTGHTFGVDVNNTAIADFSSTALTLGTGVNLVMAAGQGIDFSATANGSGTATSEVLSDYEEGTWTPTLVNSGSNTYTTQTGTYTKVGRLVTVQGLVVVNVATTPSGTLEILGLPFTVSAGQKGAISIYANGVSVSATTTWLGAPTPASNAIRVYTYAAGALTNPGGYVASGCVFAFSASYEV